VLVALAYFRDRYVSSEILGKSVGTNPVVVRRMLPTLKKAGLIKSQGGVYGGTQLAKPPEEISLRDIFEAVEEAKACRIHDSNQNCCVARTIERVVPDILNEVEEARRQHLDTFSVADILGQIELMVEECDKPKTDTEAA
jgi:Rrf2 family protein